MRNLEFVSMVDLLHEPKSDKKWKLFALFGVGGLMLLTYFSLKKNQKQGRALLNFKSELDKEKAISKDLRDSNEELNTTVLGQVQHIQELMRKNQDMARRIAEDIEKKNRESQPQN